MPSLDKTPPQIVSRKTSIDSESKSLQKKQTTTFFKKIEALRKDPTIALGRWISAAPVLLAEWSVEKTADAPEGAQEFISDVVLPFRTQILEHGYYGSFDYGWAPFEKVFAQDKKSGNIVLAKLKPLLQELTTILAYDDDGSFAGLQQTNPNDSEDVILETPDCLLLYFSVEGTNWYGVPVLTNAETPYDQWNTIEKGADRYDRKLAGSHWVIYYPLGTSMFNGEKTDNYLIAKSILQDLESSGTMVMPSTLDGVLDDLTQQVNEKKAPWRIEVIEETGGNASYIQRQQYQDVLKIRALGLPERSVLEGQFGTKAEADIHGDMGMTIVEFRHETLVKLVNWHLVNQLLRLNFGEEAENTVYIKPSKITSTQREQRRELFNTLMTDDAFKAVIADQVDGEALLDSLGIPIKPANNSDIPGVTDPVENPPVLEGEDPDNGDILH